MQTSAAAELREDVPALISVAGANRAKLIYVSNPNNPIGSYWTADHLTVWMGNIPSGAMLLLDEAYSDTAPPGAVPPLDVTNPQVLRFRTFSKAYGLAGARLGYAIGHADVIAMFNRVRNQYAINRIGQVGALAALQDQPYLAGAVTRIARARQRIADIAAGCGLKALPSAAGFVAIDCGGDAAFAERVLDALMRGDVFARKPRAPGLDHLIRVSAGIDADLAVFAEVLPLALHRARASDIAAAAR